MTFNYSTKNKSVVLQVIKIVSQYLLFLQTLFFLNSGYLTLLVSYRFLGSSLDKFPRPIVKDAFKKPKAEFGKDYEVFSKKLPCPCECFFRN